MQSAVVSHLRHVRFESFGRDDVCPICLEALASGSADAALEAFRAAFTI